MAWAFAFLGPRGGVPGATLPARNALSWLRGMSSLATARSTPRGKDYSSFELQRRLPYLTAHQALGHPWPAISLSSLFPRLLTLHPAYSSYWYCYSHYSTQYTFFGLRYFFTTRCLRGVLHAWFGKDCSLGLKLLSGTIS